MFKSIITVALITMVSLSSTAAGLGADNQGDIRTLTSSLDEGKTACLEASKVSERSIKIKTKKIKELKHIDKIAEYVSFVNGEVPKEEAKTIARSIVQNAKKHNVKEETIMAIIETESDFHKDAVSSENFKGLMQTSDTLARESGFTPQELFIPKVSIAVGTKYIARQIDFFDGNLRKAFTAYNQGPGTVLKGTGKPGYANVTIAHMEKIKKYLKGY